MYYPLRINVLLYPSYKATNRVCTIYAWIDTNVESLATSKEIELVRWNKNPADQQMQFFNSFLEPFFIDFSFCF